MTYKISAKNYNIVYDPETLILDIKVKNKVWSWNKELIKIKFNNGTNCDFTGAKCCSTEFNTGVSNGVNAVYSGFSGSDIIIHTSVIINKTDDTLCFSLYTENEKRCETETIYWPAAFDFDIPEGRGYTILPLMHGVLVPSRWNKPIIQYNGGKIYDRDGYMAFFGQIDNGSGYCAVYETPYDAGYHTAHTVGGRTLIHPYWKPSLGYISYKRSIRYSFVTDGDYNNLSKIYRNYLIERGKLVTLKEKIDRNPNVAKLIGAPVIHDLIAVHISPDSDYYNKDDPKKNDYHNTFESRETLLKRLKSLGVEKAYLHYDGWGAHGYDNLHPSPFPVHEGAGGAEGMKKLSDTAEELGYIFGVHDQYRDYYYDGDDYSADNAIENADGSHPFCSVWYGGKHSYLCASLAPDYVRRNYNKFKELGIGVKGSYLDVFSVVEMDECFNKNHIMSREQCAAFRRESLDHLTYLGIIPSSEEVTDCIIPSMALCHHAPFAVTSFEKRAEAVGISIPLFSLVHHDCIVVPWFGVNGEKGGWGIPSDDYPYLWGLLCGGTIYYSASESQENIDKGKTALKLHEKLAFCEMISHEFIDNDYRRHRAVYSDGTVVEIDMNTGSYNIK